MKSRTSRLSAFALVLIFLMPLAHAAPERTSFRIAWSLYVGWMPWDYADRSGILKKWADRFGISIELHQVNAYVDSIDQYTAGRFDGCAMTNVDLLTIPAAAGVDSTAIIVGDFSNGNDGIVLKGGKTQITDLKTLPIHLVKFSVSHYLLARALASAGLTETDVRIVNASDASIAGDFAAARAAAVVTWKPQLADVLAVPGTSLVYDSSRIPREIIDLMVINTAILKANPNLGRALAGAWYETIALMSARNGPAAAAMTSMAKASGTDLEGFRSQLATTKMFIAPSEASGFMKGANLQRTMDLVRDFSFTHGLMGAKAKSVDSVAIEFPNGEVLGDPQNIKARFDSRFTQLAAEGRLQASEHFDDRRVAQR